MAWTLFRWREEILLAGWDGSATSASPPRLRDFAAVEAVRSALPPDPSPAERLARLVDEIPRRSLPIAGVEILDDPAGLPALWRRALDALAARGIAIEPSRAPSGNAPGDLGHLQRTLSGASGPAPARGDGSLLLLAASSDVEAAEATASWLASQSGPAVVIDAAGDALLDQAVRQRGLPSAGASASSRLRPALQVLPLALALQWEPVDPNRALELLSLPVGPVPRAAALSLARAIAGSPGIGGTPWHTTLAYVAERMREAGAAARSIDALMQEIREWTQPVRFRTDDGMPREVVAATCARVARWLAGRIATSGDDDVLWVALGAAREAKRLAETDSQPRLTPPALRRLLDAASQAGAPHPGATAEAGHVPCVSSPAAILASVPTVVWWDFTAAGVPPVAPSPWSIAERAALAREGIALLDPAADRLRRTQADLTPLRAASARVVLVAPERRRGEPATRHPLWDRITSGFGGDYAAVVVQARDWLGGTLPSAPVPRRPLARPKRWWRLPAGALSSSHEHHSFTSLNAFINHPFQWALRYKARIKAGFTARLADDNLLLGSLAHGLIAEAAGDPTLAGAGIDAIRAALERRLDVALAGEGAVLLLPGRGADRRKLLDRSARGALVLLDAVRRGGWRILGFEHALDGAFDGGALEGRLDVALEHRDGRRGVIDVKWGGRKYRRAELRENTALQLALYGHLLARSGQPWPASAYLVLDPPTLLSADASAFPGAVHVTDTAGAPADLWATVGPTWRWRRALLERGWIEMTAGTEPDDDSAPPIGCRLTQTECRFNDYASLTGFVPEEHP
ncbi:MAG: PD-(D/E)XK nuclease family protein [bacterium]|nr:PD-(D/E)XK nuclease family protein [bacterium]